MKAGLAAAMLAAHKVGGHQLRGDVWVAAVTDEEDASRGSLEVLQVCPNVQGAIFPEPTGRDIYGAHRGFVWFEISVAGKAAHGSRFDLGVDAIAHMGLFLASFKVYCDNLLKRPQHPLLGHGSAHAGKIYGGQETSTFPTSVTVTIERRTLPGETDDLVLSELATILDQVKTDVAGIDGHTFDYSVRKALSRPPLGSRDGPFVNVVETITRRYLQSEGGGGERAGGAFWTDAALFSDQRMIESIVVGPKEHGIPAEEEWVDIRSLQHIVGVYEQIITEFCA